MLNAHEIEQMMQAHSCAQASVLLRVDVVIKSKASTEEQEKKMNSRLVEVSHVRLNQVHHTSTLRR
jgi:hypothetical protein